VLTWPVIMDNDDCTPYCRILQLASEKNNLPWNLKLICDANIRSYDCMILRERWISCLLSFHEHGLNWLTFHSNLNLRLRRIRPCEFLRC
jgi:hypothetical protein